MFRVKKCRFLSIFFFLISAVILFFSCAPVRDSDSPEGIYSLAFEALEDDNAALALELFDRGLDEYPEHPLKFEFLLGKAKALLMLDRLEESLLAANDAFSSVSDSRSANMALLLIAQIESTSGKYASCFETLRRLDEEYIEPADAESTVTLLREILEKLNFSDLQAAQSTDSWTRVYILLELFDRYMAQGDLEKVLLIASEIKAQYPDAFDRYGIADIENSIEHPIIALVLPLSAEDEAAAFANQTALGVELAMQRASGLYRNPPELVIYDFAGNTDSLISIITSLARNPACIAVIGPLTSNNVHAIADIAIEYGLPIVSPITLDSDEYDGFIHRLCVNPGQGIASVAEYAVRTAGCTRLAVIHEYTAESIADVEIFEEVVISLGAEIVSIQGYEIGTTDYKAQIQAIKYYHPDGIFLPITANDAVVLAPQLAYHRVDIPLFGSTKWDNDVLLDYGDEYLEGAVFPVSSNNMNSSINPETEAFLWYYERQYNSVPDILAAQGYDTARMLLGGVEIAVLNRGAFEIYLSGLVSWLGASGFCSFGSDASFLSSAPLVRVIDGDVTAIE